MSHKIYCEIVVNVLLIIEIKKKNNDIFYTEGCEKIVRENIIH